MLVKTIECLLTENCVDREDDNADTKKMVPLDSKNAALNPESWSDDHSEKANEDHKYHALVDRVYFPEVKVVCCVAKYQNMALSYCS